jgi:hypothetical protein
MLEREKAPLLEQIKTLESNQSDLESRLSDRDGQLKFIANSAKAMKEVRKKTRSDTGSLTDDEGEVQVLAQFSTIVERSAAFMALSPDSKVISRSQMMEELRKPIGKKNLVQPTAEKPTADKDPDPPDSPISDPSTGTAASAPTPTPKSARNLKNLMDFEVEEDVEPKTKRKARKKTVKVITGSINELSEALGKCADLSMEIPPITAAFKRAAQSTTDQLYAAVMKEGGYEMQLEGMLKDKWGIKLQTRDIRYWILFAVWLLHVNKVPLIISEPTSTTATASPGTSSAGMAKALRSKKK